MNQQVLMMYSILISMVGTFMAGPSSTSWAAVSRRLSSRCLPPVNYQY